MMYGCHNKPRPVKGASVRAMDGYRVSYTAAKTGTMVICWKSIPFTMSTECQYDKSATDTSCKGCQWAKTE